MNHAYDIDGQACAFSQFNQVALNPNASVVVRACAGSGKTWLLTSRIVRLLLDGVLPNQILAITFTKKAAQEMRDRVAAVLALLADASNDAVLTELCARGLSEAQALAHLPQARGLYDAVLGSGQEIPIYTFHAWFYRLLQAAPMGSPAKRNATLTEDASELKQMAWADFYEALNQAGNEDLRAHFLYLIRELGDSASHKALEQALYNSTEINLFAQQCVAHDLDVLSALALDISADTGLDIEQGEQGAYTRWSEQLNQNGQFDVLIQALSCGNADKQARSQGLLRVFNSEDPLEQWRALAPYLVADGSRLNGTLFKTDAKQRQTMEASITIEQYEAARQGVDNACAQLQNDLADCRVYALNAHMMPCVQALLEAYRQIKSKLGQLDFSDIELMCYQMLQSELSAAYVQVQLDARYKHLLFDEFQDTNPLQWQIIHSWLAAYDFDSMRPKVFLVGDVKQSIYRFRKADARVFDQAQQLLLAQYDARVLRTHATRRNSQAVVSWVNAMFAQPDCALVDFSQHITFNQDVGHVGVLSLPELEAPPQQDASPTRNWLTQAQHVIEANERDDESLLIIDAIQKLVGQYPVKDEQSGQYRPARYSDIMLLVYNRTHLAGYERLLRQAHIPFVSSKRGGLLSTLEALDMMALLQWLMDADNDTALLHVLRTPIFDVSQEDIAFLLKRRALNELSYWQALDTSEDLSEALSRAQSLLRDWLICAPRLSPHDVLDKIYSEGRVFQCYAYRAPIWLNAQVQANLRAFLQLALAVNAGRYPSLWTFLLALQRWQEQEQDGLAEAEPMGMNDAVRILTVHGSKGLESPIVMLIDMKNKAHKNDNLNSWFIDWQPNEALPNHVSWVGKSEQTGGWRAARFVASSERAALEKLNLCYVAMTRARQLLLVSAAHMRQEFEDDAQDKGLYAALSHASAHVAESLVLPQDIEQWQWSECAKAQALEPIMAKEQMNVWSDMLPDEPIAYEPALMAKLNESALLGTAWHGVLEYTTQNEGTMLPISEVVARFGVRYSQADDVIKWAQNTLSQPDWQLWFDPQLFDEACNEMSVITALGQNQRIDRWVRKGNTITVIDYKLSWDEANLASYRQQVLGYMALMGQLYPDCQINGVLLSGSGQMLVDSPLNCNSKKIVTHFTHPPRPQ